MKEKNSWKNRAWSYLSPLSEFLFLAHDWKEVQVLEGASGFSFLFVYGHVNGEDHGLQFVNHRCLCLNQEIFALLNASLKTIYLVNTTEV